MIIRFAPANYGRADYIIGSTVCVSRAHRAPNGCFHWLDPCFDSPNGCYHSTNGCYHSLNGCFHSLNACYRSPNGCYYLLDPCFYSPKACYHSLNGCYHSTDACFHLPELPKGPGEGRLCTLLADKLFLRTCMLLVSSPGKEVEHGTDKKKESHKEKEPGSRKEWR
jgi:hypothetical protein